MNFRITTLFFALLLTTLWVFGLMIAHRKTAVDQTAIVPSLQEFDIKIDKVVITQTAVKGKDPATFEFVNRSDHWFFKEGTQQVRVEDFRIKEMIDAIKDARQDDFADLSKDLAHYGLAPPQLTVVLSGKLKDDSKEWKFFVGKESPEKSMYYVNSAERDQKAFAVGKRPIDKLFVANLNLLRSKRLFDFIESGVTDVAIQKGDKKLELKRKDGNLWVFVEPKHLGFVGFDSAAPEDKMPEDKFHPQPKKKPEEAISGVKALLNSIVKVTVEDVADFVPPGAPRADFDLDAKTAPMRIEISTADDNKNPVKDTLLVGKKVPTRKETYYYARLASDDGVFMLSEKTIAPIDQALADPGKLRSLDIAVFNTKDVDHVVLRQGKDKIEFFLPDPAKPWDMFIEKEKKKTNDSAVDALVVHMTGKKAIIEFLDVTDADKEKKLAEWELKSPAAEVAVYVNAIEKPKKDEKPDEKKDDKDKKDGKEKKEDAKKMPELKKDVKAALKLEFGKTDKDHVFVRRTLENGTESFFKVKKEFLDKIAPAEGIELTYLDTSLPDLFFHNVLTLKIERKIEKGTEVIALERHSANERDVWYVKDPLEPTGLKLAENKHMFELASHLSGLKAKKWLKKLDDKDDLDKHGLKSPGVTVSFKLAKNAEDLASIMGTFGGSVNPSALAAICGALARHQTDKGTETVTLQFGSEAFEEKEKGKEKDKEKIGTYAKHSGSKLLFVVPNDLVKFVKEVDLRDRASALHTHGQMTASLIGIAAGNPFNALMIASPYTNGQVHLFDADKIKEIRLSVRTPFELRSFQFERVGKDKVKTWTDKSGLQEFQLDPDKVAQFVKDFAKLRTERFVAFLGGPRGEHKLGPKEYTVKLDLLTDDGKTVTLRVGTSYQAHGYYANSTYWPETVFLIPAGTIEPLLRGASHFAKERTAGAN